MINYIKSEFYRLLHSKGSYLFIIICTALLLSANIILALVGRSEASFPYDSTAFTLGLFYTDLPMVFLLCVSVVSTVFGNEHTNHTMKNSVSFGLSRGCIYIGKFLVEIIYSLVAFLIIGGVFVGSSYLLLENSNVGELELLFRASFAALPLLLFALATSNCFLFIIEGTGGAITATIGALLALPIISNYLGLKFVIFQKIAKILPWNLITNMKFNPDKIQLILPWEGSTGYLNYWLYGGAQMLLFVLIGYFVFSRKEIK